MEKRSLTAQSCNLDPPLQDTGVTWELSAFFTFAGSISEWFLMANKNPVQPNNSLHTEYTIAKSLKFILVAEVHKVDK